MAISSTTYKKKWRSGKTKVLRVPEALADELLKIAVLWDETAGDLRVREDDGVWLIDVPPQPRKYDTQKQVNVATVPMRSPFRYPGGKTWLVPQLRNWLLSKNQPSRFVEPFAGGAIASMTVGFERLAKQVIFAELDNSVAAVWRVVLNGQAEWLAERILTFKVTKSAVEKILSEPPAALRDLAFQTIIRNRMQRGGIMAPGAGLTKTGENGNGLLSRWYPETLARRIRDINARKDRFSFVHGDAFALLTEHANDAEAVHYIDPPYTIAARRLYPHWQVDHAKLFAATAELKGDFLMSYDDSPEVRRLAAKHGFAVKAIAMKNTHHAEQKELLIGRDLSWVAR